MTHIRGALDEARPLTPAEVDWREWYLRDTTFYEPEVWCSDCRFVSHSTSADARRLEHESQAPSQVGASPPGGPSRPVRE